jgi:RHS repeat-associated protein
MTLNTFWRVAVSTTIVLVSLAGRNAFAFDPDIQWKVVGHNPPVFTTKAQAKAHMLSLTSVDPRYALLTVERLITQLTETSEIYQYEAPRLAPTTSDWSYRWQWGNVQFSSESAAIAAKISDQASSPECASTTVQTTSSWTATLWSYGGVSTSERRYVTVTYNVYRTPSNQAPYCEANSYNDFIVRSRQLSCPANYSGESAQPGCYVPLTAKIEGRRLDCDGCGNRGNPGNALTGDKVETVVDYRGPNGLEFVRYYHSKSLDETYLSGVGWSHNYQRYVVRSGLNNPTGLVRANGYKEYVTEVSGQAGTFISRSGSGIVIRKISSALWQVHLKDGSVESYDAKGQLTQISDPSGKVTTLTYVGGQLTTVTGPFGHFLSFEYDAAGRLYRVLANGSLVVEYTYIGSNLGVVNYPDGTNRTYHYEDTSFPNNLTGITDESGIRFATFSYDSMGRVASTEHAGATQRYQFNYNPTNTLVLEPLGTTETINFTTTANLARRLTQLSKSGIVQTFTVPTVAADPQRRVTQKTDGKGNVTKFSYDTFHLLNTTQAFGTPIARTTAYSYLDNFSDKPLLVTEPNRTIGFTYDGKQNPLTRTVTDTSVIPNIARVWTYTYNSQGQILTEDGPRTDVADTTTYSYYTCTLGYQCGQLSTITNALGHVTTYNSYNANGQSTQITDANGLVTSLGYDARQRLSDRCVGGALPACTGGELTHMDYWPTGLLKKVTNPDGSLVEYIYDAAHRLTEVRDGALNRIVYTLDNMGNRTAENTYDPSNALRRTHARVYNTLNQLWKDVNAANTAAVTTTFGYDNNGNQTTTNAPLSRNSTSVYDELNRLKEITDPASGITQFGYDANDNLTSVTDPRNLVTSYTYSGFGDLKTQASPDTGVTTNTYDSAGNIDTSTDSRGVVTDYDYDVANRPTSVSFTLGGVTDQTITYGYDAGTNQNGRLTSAADANHTLAWTYDSHGRVTGKGQTVGSTTLAIGYGYDGAGRLGNVTLPSGSVVTYGYNANGQVTSVTLNGSTTIINGITYDPFGPITGWTWGNGTFASRGFDTDGKITQVDNANGASLKNYSYDDAFRITGIGDAGNGALSWTYGYDLLDRLTSATSTSVSQGWTYDANGNRLTQTGTTPSSYSNSSSSNRVNSISGSLARTYGYDNAGNTLGFGSATFTYNNRGRMLTASNGGITATYTYNALGQRIKRATASATAVYVYDEAGHLAGEYTAAGALVQETVWLGDTPIATLRPNGSGGVVLYYVHADHLNTPRLINDTSNNLRWRWDSDAFGTNAPSENPSGLGTFEYGLRFPGQQYDGVMGLHYNYFRDYDPTVGRYVQSDPIGLEGGGFSTYAYVLADPLRKIDPRGLQIEECKKPDCKAVKEKCLAQCSEDLPTTDFGFQFWNCVNKCMAEEGCEPDKTPTPVFPPLRSPVAPPKPSRPPLVPILVPRFPSIIPPIFNPCVMMPELAGCRPPLEA